MFMLISVGEHWWRYTEGDVHSGGFRSNISKLSRRWETWNGSPLADDQAIHPELGPKIN
jgi:hypothetical protein